MLVSTLLAFLRHEWSGWDSILHRVGLVWILLSNCQRLERESFTASALEHHRLLTVNFKQNFYSICTESIKICLRAALLALKLSGVHPNEESCIEIDWQAQQRLDVSTITICMSFDASEQNSQRHFMAGLRFQRNRAVFRNTSFWSIAGKHSHVSCSHEKQSAFLNALNCTVEKFVGSTIRI